MIENDKMDDAGATASTERERIATRLRRFAVDCEHIEDDKRGPEATFVPGVLSGDFYDTLMSAAHMLAGPASHDAQESGCDCTEDCKRGFDHPLHCSLATPKPEAAGALAGEAIGLRFGLGGLIVNTGTHEGEPAVIIDVASQPGEIGAKAPDVPADTLAPVRLVFPTAEQAQRVSDALVNAPTANAELIERFRLAVSTMFKGEQDENGKRCHPRYSEDLETMAEVFAALSAAPVAAQQPAPSASVEAVAGVAARCLRWLSRDAAPEDAAEAEAHAAKLEALAQQPAVVGDVPETGSTWRHKNGNEYTVLLVANLASERNEYPVTVVYRGQNGKVWSRPLSRWHGSMTALTPAATPVPVGGEGRALLRYGRHDPDCDTCHDAAHKPRPTCTCGYSDALAQQGPVVDEALLRWIEDPDTIPQPIIRATHDAIQREFGDSGTDGYYKRILATVFAALAHTPQDGRKGEEG